MTMNFGADCGLMGLVAERKGGKESSHGYIFQKGQPDDRVGYGMSEYLDHLHKGE